MKLPSTNPFERLESYVQLEYEAPFSFAAALEAHMVRAIRSVQGGRPNRFIFTLVSKDEYIGKTRLIEWLFPKELRQYCMSTMAGRKEKRDALLASKFLINLDEFSGAKESANAALKAMVSQESAALFIPFTNRVEQRPRITTFFATKNYRGEAILSPSASNSRYIIYNVKAIDWAYVNHINPTELWAWAAALAADPSYAADPSIEEIRFLEAHNARYSVSKRSKRRSKRTYSRVGGAALAAALIAAIAAIFRSWSFA